MKSMKRNAENVVTRHEMKFKKDRMKEWMNGRIDEWIKWINEWKNEGMKERMNEWMNDMIQCMN